MLARVFKKATLNSGRGNKDVEKEKIKEMKNGAVHSF